MAHVLDRHKMAALVKVGVLIKLGVWVILQELQGGRKETHIYTVAVTVFQSDLLSSSFYHSE